MQLEQGKTKDPKEARKDRVMQWLPPFGKDDVKLVYETTHEIASVQYSEDCQTLFLTQTIDNLRQISAVDLKDEKKTVYVISKGAPGAVKGGKGKGAGSPDDDVDEPDDDAVNDGAGLEQQPKKGGGAFGGGAGVQAGLMAHASRGELGVVRISTTGDVYVSGTDRTGGAVVPRPYIDKINIKTGMKTRIFEGRGDMPETIDAVDSDDIAVVFTTRQKEDVVPDSYRSDLASGKDRQSSPNNVDPQHRGFTSCKVENDSR